MTIVTTATVCFHATMTRAGKRMAEREAVAALIEAGYRRQGEPKLWVSKAGGFEEFKWTYVDGVGNIATLKTRHLVRD